MNGRDRFINTLQFKEIDRPFRWETPGFWGATRQRWIEEGFPTSISPYKNMLDYFGMDKVEWIKMGGWTIDPYYPMFEKKILDDDGVNLTIIDKDGITKKIRKVNPETSMPQFLKFPVKTKEDYEKNIKGKLNYTDKGRFPDDWDEKIKEYEIRDYPLGFHVSGPFGHLRNLMGDEELMYAFFDEPELVHEIMQHWKEFYFGYMKLVCNDVIPDFIMLWEDICFKCGPLVSPAIYNEFMAPYLKDVIKYAKNLGILGIIVDTDGDATIMLPIYLDCGANAFYPFEVQAGMDIVEIRKQYGDKFAILGGLEKLTLAKGKEEILNEIDSKVPYMLKQGGYIPMLDHTVPPNVSFDMFKFYIKHLRDNY